MKNVLSIAAVVLAAHAPLATAQMAAAATDPVNPHAPVPSFSYDSALTGYRNFQDVPLAPWRDVNDEVARVGGHLGIFRTPQRDKDANRAGTKPAAGDGAREPGSQAGRPR